MKQKRYGWMSLLISLLLIGAIVALSGCISEEEKDSDGDGVPDDEDQYPGEDDKLYLDDDGDGVLNKDDKYPDRNDTMFGGNFIRWTAEPSTLDPIMATDTASAEIINKVFEGLVMFKAGTTEIEPRLAKSWTTSSDGLEWTFKLQEGVTFHNGRNMTAEDVKYSLERLMDPASASPRIGFAEDIESITVVDESTVTIKTKYVFVPFLSKLAYTCFNIVPKEEVEKHGDDWFKNPVGTGPFKFVKWEPGSVVQIEAYDDYWRGRAYLDQYTIYVHEDDETIWQGFLSGEIHLAGVPSAHWEEYLADEQMVKYSMTIPELATYWLYFNCQGWPFENKAIRNAVCYALQKDDIIQTVFKGRYMPATQPLPPGLWGFDQTLHDNYKYKYNPAEAKKLLDDAGVVDTDGDGIREYQGKPLILEYSSYISPSWETASQTHLANLMEIGIQGSYKQYEFPTLIGMADEGNYTLMTLGWIADYADPENFMILFESQNIPDPNHAHYASTAFDELADKGKKETDLNKRLDLYKQMIQHLQEENPHWWYMHSRATHVYQPFVHGLEIGSMGEHQEQFLEVWIDPKNR
jgi:peptide/nickel transport system substrate-binding protein